MKSLRVYSTAAPRTIAHQISSFTQKEVARVTHSRAAGRLFCAISRQASNNLDMLSYGSQIQGQFGWIPLLEEKACEEASIKQHRLCYYLTKLRKYRLLQTTIEENFHGYGKDVIFCCLPFLTVSVWR